MFQRLTRKIALLIVVTGAALGAYLHYFPSALPDGGEAAFPALPGGSSVFATPELPTPRQAPEPQTRIAEERTYRLQVEAVCSNEGTRPSAAQSLIIPIAGDHEYWQKSELSRTELVDSFSPKPQSIERDTQGNLIARFELPSLAPGEIRSFSYTTRLKKYGTAWDLSFCPPMERARKPELCHKILHELLAAEEAEDQGTASPEAAQNREKNINSDISLLRQTAAQVLHDAQISPTDTAGTIGALYHFVRSFNYELKARPLSIREILSRKAPIQCEDASRLLCLLCNSCDLPTRQVSGLYFMDLDPLDASLHSWTEIYLPGYGYITADPTMGRFEHSAFSRLAQCDTPYLTIWQGSGVFRNLYRRENRDLGALTGHKTNNEADDQVKIAVSLRCLTLPAQSSSQDRAPAAWLQALEPAHDQAHPSPAAPQQAETLEMLNQAVNRAYERKEFDRFWKLLGRALNLAQNQEEYTTMLDLYFLGLQMAADTGEWAMMRDLSQMALQHFPQEADLSTALLMALLHLQPGDMAHLSPKVQNMLSAMQQAAPQDGYPLFTLGQAYGEAGYYQLAIQNLERSVTPPRSLSPQERQQALDLIKKLKGYYILQKKFT